MKRMIITTICIVLITMVIGCQKTIQEPAQIAFKAENGTVLATEYDLVAKEAKTQEMDGINEFLMKFKDPKKLAKMTEENLGKPIHIYYKDELISSPIVNNTLIDGWVVVTGIDEETVMEMIQTIQQQ
ncbi:hypothetical protein BHU72_01560 [Desulfuribacillus stibiiarsenatis]|uniref:SecDF P1 head subdomain domain-containing protein n=1 Tax=Desulfuribacillus stibiiarsenatis TaxID=1390249 RepID=A0A1E5LA22_9FIRM|nr:hypothetical protein [Desulfuribacillus stibiiarsenatis]OEH86971.1 hypothetical protein BHU72_01560 [Desulfuribacillus stibiiarsenatis]